MRLKLDENLGTRGKSKAENPQLIFNRAIKLKDTWKKEAKKGN